jgi:hypothetical protein
MYRFRYESAHFQIDVSGPMTSTIRVTQKGSISEFWQRIHSVAAATMPFSRAPSFRGICDDDTDLKRAGRSCLTHQCPGGSDEGNGDVISLPLGTRDVKRLIRMERALRHVPFDVEVARVMSTDRFSA